MNFAAGGIATPADAALMMQLGAEACSSARGSSSPRTPRTRARAIVEATTHYKDPDVLAEVSRGLGEPMPGIEIGRDSRGRDLLQTRGW